MSFGVTSDKDQQTLINNRQNGRRRGRGGPQVRGGGGGNGSDRGNRIDNRARGNAVQLHEKYKNLARDAQTQGDRVMTEYYLQFADHYFRVLSENRARFEDQQQPRRPRDDGREEGRFEGDFFDADQDEGEEGLEGERYDRRPQRNERPQPERREPERAQPERAQTERVQPDRSVERVREPQAAEAADASVPSDDGEPKRARRGRRPRRPEGEEGAPRIDMDRLPPALAPEAEPVAAAPAEPVVAELGEEAPKRRRTRRAPKDENDSSVAA